MRVHVFITILLFMLLFTVSVAAQSLDDVTVQDIIQVECGDIIEGEFTSNYERHRYSLSLEAGAQVSANAVPVGDQLRLAIGLVSPTGLVFRGSDPDAFISEGSYYILRIQSSPSINSGVLSARGSYRFFINNYSWIRGLGESGGSGLYTFFISCTLRDGTVIEAGDNLASVSDDNTGSDSDESSSPAEPVVQSIFSGFGFPGVLAVDFSEGIEIPLTLGQAQTVPLGGDIALYTYGASAEEIVTLSVARVSGDISIGVTVINTETNEIIFLGGMPSSNNLSVELTFTSAGTYAVGLFRLDTAERVDTSGAVSLVIE
ncbi:MAG: hypothetical protein AAFR81_17075 [Chloroflexota bacterium]